MLIIILLGVSSCSYQYVCPAMYQEPTNVKAIPSKYEKLEVSKMVNRSQKLQKKTSKNASKNASKKGKGKSSSKRSR